MQIVDILGREVKVGDIVVSINSSTSYRPFFVVTRLGSTDRVQVNGCSYIDVKYILVCNEQFVLAKGAAAAEDLVAEQREHFQEKQVEKKPPSPKFWIFKCQDYQAKNPARYFVVKIQGNAQESYKQIEAFFKTVDLSAFGEHYSEQSLSKNNRWLYSDISHAKTARQLVELNLEEYINKEVPAEVMDKLLVA